MMRSRPMWGAPEWFIDDGCSGVPDYDRATRAACRQHDWAYWLGGGRTERKSADLRFRSEIIAAGGLRRWLRAWRWYVGVRMFGCRSFHWGDDRFTRGLDDLFAIYIEEFEA